MTPNWGEGNDYCLDIGLRVCHRHHDVTIQKNFLLFDITNEPGESSPISSENRSTKKRRKCIHPVIKKHEETIDSAVPKQLKAHKNVFHSTLQRCCNFPFCSCKETNRNLLVGLLVRALAFHQCGLGSISALSHMWIESVGSLLFSERFFPGYSGFPLSSKTNI